MSSIKRQKLGNACTKLLSREFQTSLLHNNNDDNSNGVDVKNNYDNHSNNTNNNS